MDLMSSEHTYQSDVTDVKLYQLIHVIYYCETLKPFFSKLCFFNLEYYNSHPSISVNVDETDITFEFKDSLSFILKSIDKSA